MPSVIKTAFLLPFLVIFNFVYISRHRWSEYSGDRTQDYSYKGHDFPPTFPLEKELDNVLMTVEESARYPLSGWASDPEWFSLSTSSAGYARLGPDNRIFVVTMFHELHCLRLLNLAFDPSNIVSDGHIQHCLGYLRQMSLCRPDMTLERAGWETRDFSFDKIGSTHECRDWSAVYSAVEENTQRWNHTIATS